MSPILKDERFTFSSFPLLITKPWSPAGISFATNPTTWLFPICEAIAFVITGTPPVALWIFTADPFCIVDELVLITLVYNCLPINISTFKPDFG